jgi:hypothetical protein
MPISYEGNYIGAQSIDELAAALKKFQYTPRTDAERRTEAENMYANQRDQALLSAQQTYDTSDLALRNQLIGLADAYNRQIESQNEATRLGISMADRRALQRGMQRSTYNNSTLNNIQLKGDKAVAEIQQNRTNDENRIAGQRALLAQQLAQNQASARSTFEQNVIARIAELANEDYERQTTADQYVNNIQLKLYELLQQDRALQAKAGKGGGGGGSGSPGEGSGSGSGGGATKTAVTQTPRTYDDVRVTNPGVLNYLNRNNKISGSMVDRTTRSAIESALLNGTEVPSIATKGQIRDISWNLANGAMDAIKSGNTELGSRVLMNLGRSIGTENVNGNGMILPLSQAVNNIVNRYKNK